LTVGTGESGRRILFVITSFDLGGAERHLTLVASNLAKRGWQPMAYCIERRGHQADVLEAAGVKIIGPPVEAKTRHASRTRRTLRRTLAAMKLLGILLKYRPRIVHFFLPAPYALGAPLAVLTRVPIRIMSRRSLNLYQGSHLLSGAIERRLHRSMSVVLGNSASVLLQLVEEEGVPPDKAELIYNGVDLSAFADQQSPSPDNVQRRGGDSKLVLIKVANLLPYKGHADLLRALASVKNDLPDWTLQCVGRNEGCGEQLAKLATDLGLKEHVQFLGERIDIADLLKHADIGTLSSHEEGFSNAILEGMAAGLPMVVTDVGGNSEAVVDGETGLVVPPRDAEALGAAILSLALNYDMRARMGEAGRARASKRFSLDACVASYDRLYRRLIVELDSVRCDSAGPQAND